MTKKKTDCTTSDAANPCCCRVEAVTTVDARGQMVLPKEIRERAQIKAGDRLAVVSFEQDGKSCCICLVKADELVGSVRDLLGPMVNEMNKS